MILPRDSLLEDKDTSEGFVTVTVVETKDDVAVEIEATREVKITAGA